MTYQFNTTDSPSTFIFNAGGVRRAMAAVAAAAGETTFVTVDFGSGRGSVTINLTRDKLIVDGKEYVDAVEAAVALNKIVNFKSGGGSPSTTPDLQAVTDKGSATTLPISIGEGDMPSHAVRMDQLAKAVLFIGDFSKTPPSAENPGKFLIVHSSIPTENLYAFDFDIQIHNVTHYDRYSGIWKWNIGADKNTAYLGLSARQLFPSFLKSRDFKIGVFDNGGKYSFILGGDTVSWYWPFVSLSNLTAYHGGNASYAPEPDFDIEWTDTPPAFVEISPNLYPLVATLQTVAEAGNDAEAVIKVNDGIESRDAVNKGQLDEKAPVSHTHTKADIGLPYVDNTSDTDKPLSAVQQSYIDNKDELLQTLAAKGLPGGYAPLDEDGYVPDEFIRVNNRPPLVFDTLQEAQDWLLVPANVATLVEGDDFYFVDVNTSDYWWTGERLAETKSNTNLGNYYSKIQSDSLLDGKATKVIIPQNYLLRRSGAGPGEADSGMEYSTLANAASTLARRTATGTLKAANPAAVDDLTTKQYVDEIAEDLGKSLFIVHGPLSGATITTVPREVVLPTAHKLTKGADIALNSANVNQFVFSKNGIVQITRKFRWTGSITQTFKYEVRKNDALNTAGDFLDSQTAFMGLSSRYNCDISFLLNVTAGEKYSIYVSASSGTVNVNYNNVTVIVEYL